MSMKDKVVRGTCFIEKRKTLFWQVLPLGQMLIIKEAAHMAMMEKPDDVNQIVLTFLESS